MSLVCDTCTHVLGKSSQSYLLDYGINWLHGLTSTCLQLNSYRIGVYFIKMEMNKIS